MKYISIILIALLVISCGKKTDPIPKDTLENVAPPKNFIVKPQEEGVFIANNENALLVVEKAVPDGEVCSDFTKVKILEPGTDYIDTDVKTDQAYVYRFTKITLKYKLDSDPVQVPLVYHVPPEVVSASYEKISTGYIINVVPSSEFMRMDILLGKKSIVQTGHSTAEINLDEIFDTDHSKIQPVVSRSSADTDTSNQNAGNGASDEAVTSADGKAANDKEISADQSKSDESAAPTDSNVSDDESVSSENTASGQANISEDTADKPSNSSAPEVSGEPVRKNLTSVNIVLTDYFGNKGSAYTLSLLPPKEIIPPAKVTGLSAAYLGGVLRIVWDSSSEPNPTYEIKVCENVSCETQFSSLPFLVYQKEFDKCIDITVNALTTEGRSIDAKLRFCK